MCYFVTVGIPARHRHHVEAVGKEGGGYRVERASNPSVARLFPPDDVLFTITHGGCSCDLVAERAETTAEQDEGVVRARYRRKGWSETKIARAIESRRQAHAGPRRQAPREKFWEALSTIVQATGQVRLFAHLYRESIETEDIRMAQQSTISLQEFRRHAGAFDVDTVVAVVRGSR